MGNMTLITAGRQRKPGNRPVCTTCRGEVPRPPTYLRRAVSGCMIVFLMMATEGCDMRRARKSQPSVSRGPSAEEARQALITMVENSDRQDLKMSLQNLRVDRVVQREDGSVEIGQWRCDLAARTFGVGVIAEPIFAEYTGTFSVEPSGKWQAEITGETHN